MKKLCVSHSCLEQLQQYALEELAEAIDCARKGMGDPSRGMTIPKQVPLADPALTHEGFHYDFMSKDADVSSFKV